MALINPEHLLDQAAVLLVTTGTGPIRQTDIRRSLSNSYYGLFHAILIAAASEAVGVAQQGKPLWALAYRSIMHRWLKQICNDIQAQTLRPKLRPYEPAGGFGHDILTIANAVVELQDKRHSADYDPSVGFLRSDAEATLKRARAAVSRLGRLRSDRRKAFLYLVLFEPR